MPHPFIQFIPLIIIFIIFYFLIIKPQKDKTKEHQRMISNLKKNDQIVTIGGIHGTIINVKEKTFVLRVDDNIKIEIDKNAVARLKISN
jgi:preprotein translocase subunit YajC